VVDLLVSLDVGGTLGQVSGPSLAGILAAQSPLEPNEARKIMRQRLHTHAAITDAVVADVCGALGISETHFPRRLDPGTLVLVPGALVALQSMSKHATLVTLSNVTCLEAETDRLRALLGPWVVDFFPSCRTGHAKPDREAFMNVARTCGTSTDRMVHIGDDWECDIIGARSAGIRAIWVTNGRPVPDPALLVDPDVMVAADLAAASRQIADLAVGGPQ
jgi:FMN hydrolase / 5-amino-6-(5-phospho-D-ribitylamino)uracil phosphatase